MAEANKSASKNAANTTASASPVAGSDAKTDTKADMAVRDSLGSPVPATDLGLKLFLNYINVPAKGGMTILDLLVDPQNLQFGKTDVAEMDKQQAAKHAKETGSIDKVLGPTESQKQSKDERYASTLDVYVMAFGADGKTAASFKKSIQMKLFQNTYDFVNSNGLFYHDILNLQPGLYQIRLRPDREKLD